MAEGVTGPIATRVLYEDDEIRIWDNRLGPGEMSAPHKHHHDYVIVDVAGDRIAADPLPGNEGAYPDAIEAPVRRGQASFLRRGGAERAVNVGELPYRSIIVEFKHT